MSNFIDRSPEVKRKVENAVYKALEAMAIQCESHAVKNIKSAGRVKTGRLSGSLAHQVDASEGVAYVGTNVEYAIYNEVGTGIYSSTGNGRKTPWVYVDSEGVGHKTSGMTPIHFLKNAVADHVDEYKAIAERYLKM